MHDYIYIITPVVAWLVAQSIKFILALRKDGINWSDIVQSGGLPSSHASFMVAITSVIGFNQGIKSVIFGVSASITAIVLYDSIGVRRTTGEQTDAILELSENNSKHLKTTIHISRGHNYLEVVVGCIVGFVVGYILNSII